jgi:excinuclease ABC subunit A
VPDRSLSLRAGAVKPWQSGVSAECQRDLLQFCRARGVPVDVPFARLSREHQHWVIEGDPDYGSDAEHEWPRAWYGVKGYFRWLETKSYKMHVRVLLSRYRAYRTCPECGGRRLRPEALQYRLPLRGLGWSRAREWPAGLTLGDFYALPVRDAAALATALRERHAARADAPLAVALEEVTARLGYLVEVGLGYLTLDRPTRSLSGGETERVNLTACLGTRLVNTLFVLDEPSVGLHPRDTDRLVRILERLRDAGNTVVVVEHEPAVMRAADHLVDLGPGHGETGGEVVFQGGFAALLRHPRSLTGAYLGGRERIPVPERRPVVLPEPSAPRSRPGARPKRSVRRETAPWVLADATPEELYRVEEKARKPAVAALVDGRRVVRASDLLPRAETGGASTDGAPGPADFLVLSGARRHNLKNLTVTVPLNRFVCVTGVSGSGKSTLIRDVLHPLLAARLRDSAEPEPPGPDTDAPEDAPASETPAAGATLRGGDSLARVLLVDQSPVGRTPRSNPAVYVGAFTHVRELFARSEAAIRQGLTPGSFSFNSPAGQCARCKGVGFEKIEMQFLSDVFVRCPDCDGRRYRPHVLAVRVAPPADPAAERSIADLLDTPVEEALRWLEAFGDPRPARRAADALRRLRDVGLGYLRLGQPLNTLSGGESQRLKLAAHLAEAGLDRAARRGAFQPTLFLFDEPTTGLHYHDVRVLIEVFQRLVDAGHSVLVIEHNLELIKCADWLLDLGPEGGDEGGRLVAAGPPEQIAACPASHTGRALRAMGVE